MQARLVELTYGLDRIGMFLQGVDHIKDLRWGGGLTVLALALLIGAGVWRGRRRA